MDFAAVGQQLSICCFTQFGYEISDQGGQIHVSFTNFFYTH